MNELNKALINKIKQEINNGDKRTYLENCKRNYSQYVEVANILFKDYYEMSFNKADEWYEVFTSKALSLQKEGKTEEEKEVLKSAIKNKIDTPYIYERLAHIYKKEGNTQEAYNVCNTWFDTGYWKIPNTATTSLAILNLMEKLKKNI